MSIFYPNKKFEKIEDVTPEFLKQNKIHGLILDMDNTLVKWEEEPEPSVIQWVNDMKKNKIKLCLLSNNRKGRVGYIGKKLKIPVLYSAKKPLTSGFKRAIKQLELNPENISAIGDQIFTDVWGGNRSGLYTIFIVPRSMNEHWFTKIKRPLERYVLKKYERKIENEE